MCSNISEFIEYSVDEWVAYRDKQEQLRKHIFLVCFFDVVFCFGKLEKEWRSNLKKLLEEYLRFMRTAACLPQNGHDSNIYLLLVDE